jgi:uncharacterized protein YegL
MFSLDGYGDQPGGFMLTSKLQVTPLFDFDKVSYEAETEVHLDVILTAPEKKDNKRVPLHLVLAIDCSGSMDSGKLESVKNTTYKLVDHLTENDTLGILGFSDNVWDVFKALPMTKENKDLAKNEVRKLHTIGGTNLYTAMTMAMERAVIGDDKKICRVILLTDGLPTSGNCDKEALIKLSGTMNPSLSMSTFGYGLDFDAELMASISSAGRGSNFYIKVDEDCNKAFAMELGGLLSIYGQNIRLEVTPSTNMEFKELLSDYKCEQKNGYRLTTNKKIEIQIDDIFAGEKKHIILKLSIPKATEAICARPTTVCSLSVIYTDVETKSLNSSTENIRIQYVKPSKVPKEANEEVRKQLLIIESAKIQKEAQEKAEQGDLAGARHLISQGLQNVHSNERHFGAMAAPAIAMFENMVQGFSDPFTYRTSGSKMATTYSNAMLRGRSSSADTADLYKNASQDNVLQSFSTSSQVSAGDPSPAFNMSASAGDPSMILKKDEEEEKA